MENIACCDSGKGYHEMSSYIGLIIQTQTGQCERALSYLIKLSRKLLNFTEKKIQHDIKSVFAVAFWEQTQQAATSPS